MDFSTKINKGTFMPAPTLPPLTSTSQCRPSLPVAPQFHQMPLNFTHCHPLLPTAAHCCPLTNAAQWRLLLPYSHCPPLPTSRFSLFIAQWPARLACLAYLFGNVWHNFRLGFNGSSFLGSGFPFHHHQSASYYDVSKELFSPMIPCYSLP